MIIRQLSLGMMDNFCYVVGCAKTRDALVIDPGDGVDYILEVVEQENLVVRFIFNTHHHWDHVSGNAELKEATGAALVLHAAEDDILQGKGPGSFVPSGSGQLSPPADIRIEHDDTLQVGRITFQVLVTPGHSPGGLCLYAEGQLFTGDTLFVGDSGRTDLPGGHRPTLGASIRRLMQLPDTTVVWPGHNYGPTPTSTLAWEKRHNVNAKEYGYFLEG
jgi:glyoxylase-like metal-dependent hydrolase (beta-lactamase superfamily II)